MPVPASQRMTSSLPASICTQEVLALKVPRMWCGRESRNVSTSISEVNVWSRAAHRAALTLPRIVAEDAGDGREPQEPQMIALILTVTIFQALWRSLAPSQSKGRGSVRGRCLPRRCQRQALRNSKLESKYRHAGKG